MSEETAPGSVRRALGLLEREWQTFRRERPGLLAAGNEGRFALIRGDELIGVYETEDAAADAGFDRFCLEAFLVQPLLPSETEPIYRTHLSREWRT